MSTCTYVSKRKLKVEEIKLILLGMGFEIEETRDQVHDNFWGTKVGGPEDGYRITLTKPDKDWVMSKCVEYKRDGYNRILDSLLEDLEYIHKVGWEPDGYTFSSPCIGLNLHEYSKARVEDAYYNEGATLANDTHISDYTMWKKYREMTKDE